MRERPPIGRHDYSGCCAPGSGIGGWNETFSLGIFRWEAGKQRPKPGKVKVRVGGSVTNPKPVYQKAGEICDALDAGTYAGPKTVRVK